MGVENGEWKLSLYRNQLTRFVGCLATMLSSTPESGACDLVALDRASSTHSRLGRTYRKNTQKSYDKLSKPMYFGCVVALVLVENHL